jgi:hypothetical protein
MARKTKRRGYHTLLKKKSKCPRTVGHKCKKSKKGKDICQVIAGSWRSRFMPAGKAIQSASKLKARLSKAKGCTVAHALAGYRRRR